MIKQLIFGLILLLLGLSDSVAAQSKRQKPPPTKIFLREGWTIQSSALIKEKGEVLSERVFQPQHWYPAKVPSTVAGTLVDNKVYPDPFVGMNLRAMPGCSYPIGANFSLQPMPADSPFRVSWWYRTEFRLPASYRDQNIWLHLDGVNFRANIWLNGKQIANSDQIAGTFRLHELNVRDGARAGELNTLAVEVFPALPDDLGWTWVDWSPMPPDKNMGIFRDVYLTSSGPVTLRYPQAVTHFNLPSLEAAHLTVNAEVHNATDKQVEGALSGRIEGIRFSQRIKLGPQETRSVSFTPEQFPQLNIVHPRVWWPVHLGAQNLYGLQMEFKADGKVSDRQNTRFGIREITSELDNQNHLVFKVNGKNVLIRGGGWASDMFLRFMPERLRKEFRYVKDMNLNTIRLEGQLQPDYFFDLADEYGILIMAGWCCCSHWEHWQHRDDYKEGPVWDKEDYDIAAKSQADQIRRLRNHPSLLAWLNGSDNPPPAEVEQMYVAILKQHQWPNPFISSATAKPAQFSGVSGVKMEGPYEWVPASYWLLDKKAGGAHGFATEISPGPAVPPLESLQQMIPREHLWPIDEYWNYHAGGGEFKSIKVFTDALNSRYGTAKDVRDYAMKSQLMTYEGQRAMFEAYAGNRYTSTGVIQWMLNNAWPSLIWHLYDYYLMPAGGYFGTKKACEPIHVQYSYDDKSVVAVNTTYQPQRNLKLTAQVYDFNLVEKFSRAADLDLTADSNFKAFSIPQIEDLSATYFLKLTLQDSYGRIVSSNFYWLSTRDDVLDTTKTKWYYTPVSSY
ncbi:MAG TPA: glycoside hydrolase family 2 TIM barrel-domain containing protein, partial [Pyrinomonadaceae bacterium]|nr:glycoside hydrolase family 2 TIM barrel-domain containing protein [Pyrinomonadaceae bacterium]